MRWARFLSQGWHFGNFLQPLYALPLSPCRLRCVLWCSTGGPALLQMPCRLMEDMCMFCMQEKILSETIDDLTVYYEDNGQVLVNELDKVVLSRGAWTTILFRYQLWQPEKDSFGPEMYTIRRYRKIRGEYRQQSKFNISSVAQARKIVDALNGWLADAEAK